ncbi:MULTISPECIES: hypothetical protein [Flavobacteriaceae]|uniref:hypothetical protein n=1 Tax=Flavobacteriaceae TaxID=49546 RepID=UPI001492867A|nr:MULTISPECIES: hypothetical protein [Allomuricauda]MDC6366846.1 hypothetical protein [Muricauda sp. AC10]
MRAIFGFVMLLGFHFLGQAQHKNIDLEAIAALTKKMYDAISFDNGKIPVYNLSEIYHKNAVIGAVDTVQAKIFPVVEFEEGNNAYFKKHRIVSFKEKELNATTHFYGGVAVRYSPYEFTIRSADHKVTVRGVNTIQYIKEPKIGWRIYSIFYSDTNSYPDLDIE